MERKVFTMQTKQQIEALLAASGVQLNKKLGQHFLIDLNLLRFLLDSAGLTRDDIALEVGCGTGSLTEALARRAGRVIAVEIDKSLADIAGSQLAGLNNVQVLRCDVLEGKHKLSRAVIDAIATARRQQPGGQLVLIGNLPYSVAAAVMLNLIAGPVVADAMYVTVQKEVAERMTARPSDRSYGTVSILMAATGRVRLLKSLKPSVFWPPPQVQSAMVSFVREPQKAARIKDMEILQQVVMLFMQHRRKMLKACTRFAVGRLAQITDWVELFEQAGADGRGRPDQLTPEQYLQIANLCGAALRI